MTFPGKYKYAATSWFRWDSEAVIGLGVLTITAVLSVNSFRHHTNRVGKMNGAPSA
jgi:hypothetical protein